MYGVFATVAVASASGISCVVGGTGAKETVEVLTVTVSHSFRK